MCVSRRARLFPDSFTDGRWCGGQLLSGAARKTPSRLPEPIFISLFFLIPSCPLQMKVTILHSSGAPVTSRWGSFFSPSGWRRVSRFRVVWVPCALRCTVAQRLFHTSLQENKLEIRPTKQRHWQVGAHSRNAWILWSDRVSGGVGVGQWVGYLLLSIHYVSAVRSDPRCEHNVLCRESSTAASSTSFGWFYLHGEG